MGPRMGVPAHAGGDARLRACSETIAAAADAGAKSRLVRLEVVGSKNLPAVLAHKGGQRLADPHLVSFGLADVGKE